MKYILFMAIVITCLFMEGCRYSAMSHLSDDELEWIGPYEYGDIIFFQSNEGKVDTMTITECDIRNSTNRYYTPSAADGFSSNRNYKASLSVDFNLTGEFYKASSFFLANKEIGRDTLTFLSYIDYPGIRTSISSPVIHINEFRIGKNIFKD